MASDEIPFENSLSKLIKPVFVDGTYIPSVETDHYLDAFKRLYGTDPDSPHYRDWKYLLVQEARRSMFGPAALAAEEIERGKPGSIDWFIEIGEFWRQQYRGSESTTTMAHKITNELPARFPEYVKSNTLKAWVDDAEGIVGLRHLEFGHLMPLERRSKLL